MRGDDKSGGDQVSFLQYRSDHVLRHQRGIRIDHFDLHKPLGMRMVGKCILHLGSSDNSFAAVMILAIPNLEALADTLRERSLRARTRRKVTTFVQP
jgi:hypothetical protein